MVYCIVILVFGAAAVMFLVSLMAIFEAMAGDLLPHRRRKRR